MLQSIYKSILETAGPWIMELAGAGAGEDAHATPFEPSPVDVLVLRAMLMKAMTLPRELVDKIIEFAEYFPCSHSYVEYEKGLMTGRDGNIFLIRTPPIGFRKPLSRRYSTNYHVEPVPISGEDCEPKDFRRYLGECLPELLHPVRKVVFTVESHDQGWASNARGGEYHGSCTWFEAGLERFDQGGSCVDRGEETCEHQPDDPDSAPPYCKLRPLWPRPETADDEQAGQLKHELMGRPEHIIQCNMVSSRQFMTHTVTWASSDDTPPEGPGADELAAVGRGCASGTGEVVRGLRVGDVITVWGKSRFGGWNNHVKSVKVDVYWAV